MEQEKIGSKGGYFTEFTPLWSYQAFSLKVEKELYHQKSKYQDIRVLRSASYGNVLVLDGIIQNTEKDEFVYNEMIAHVPLFSHPSPKNVLLIGGGDGGSVREVVKHPEVEAVHWCELDEEVIKVSKEYMTDMAVPFDSPKINLHIADGAKFVEDHKDEFDVVITDSSDPSGPSLPLYQRPYYEKVFACLKDDGIMCSLGDSFWMDYNLMIQNCVSTLKTLFPVVGYITINVATYPCGQIGFLMGCKNKDFNLREPVRVISDEDIARWNLKYYNSNVHKACFVLPRFATKHLNLENNGSRWK